MKGLRLLAALALYGFAYYHVEKELTTTLKSCGDKSKKRKRFEEWRDGELAKENAKTQ